MGSEELGNPSPWRRLRRWWSAWAAAAVGLAAKAKALLLILLKAKLFLSFGSLLFSSFIYGLAFGWAFGFGFIALLLIHEMGHVLALKSRGLEAPLPVFIPFVGAAIFLSRHPRSAGEEAYVAAGGPVLGFAASVFAYALGAAVGNPVFTTLAYFGFFLQAFNLVPISPLDGGRMVAAVDRRLWWVGLPVLAAVVFLTRSVMGILIGALVAYQFFMRLRRGEGAAYYDVPGRTRFMTLAAWILLIALSLAGMGVTGGVAGWT